MALLPFFFHWVDEDQATFESGFDVVDEEIFSLDLKHEEGQVPTVEIVIRNPRVGLLAPGRKLWAWIAYQPPTPQAVDNINALFGTSYTFPAIIPLFFGVLVGIPTNLFAELITLQLIARSPNHFERKQAVAETLKVAPNYDPLWLDEKHRDEPDAILEGWSALFHIDRVTLATTASDILQGEDGTIVYTEDDAFYDSVGMSLNEAPLTNVQVQATVNWTQRASGFIAGPTVNIQSYTGESFLAEWPKPGSGLGGGWRVETSFVTDVYKVAQTPTASVSNSWTNNDPDAGDCSTQTVANSSSWPALLSPNPISFILTEQTQSGICDPFATPPINRPAKVDITGTIVPLWVLNCTWTLRYDAKREFSEFLVMDVTSNTQGILASPTVEQNSELITISAANVGEPLITYDAWSDFLGLPVGLDQLIFPNDPTTPGGLSYQICVLAGVAGDVEPTFSDIPGTITVDGTVQWASLGENPQSTIQQMTFATSYGTGTILLYQAQTFDPNVGALVDVPGQTSYWLCVEPTQTTSQYTEHTYVPPVTDNNEPTPAPVTVFLEEFFPTPGMVELGVQPAFLGIPIGGTAENVTARSFFPSDRGQQSVQHLICKARARLRLRSRAVKVEWDCPFDLAVGLSCRRNATLFDPRLPGGTASGKVIAYGLKAGGDGKLIGHVEIGCAVGFGGQTSAILGTPEYTAGTGYCLPGYQRYDGATITLPSEDISYTPPVFVPFDDGLSFPLLSFPGQGVISGSAAAQADAIQAAENITRYLNNLGQQFQLNTTPGSEGQGSQSGFNAAASWWQTQAQLYYQLQALPYVMESNPVSYELLLAPVTNGPFSAAYTVEVSPLDIPMGIDLLAPSSP